MTSSRKQRFIEEVGLAMEASGLPRMAGRLLGALLVAEPREQAADDLAATLQASRGSISTASRHLERFGFVQRRGRPGERRDFFRVRPGAWIALTRTDMERLSYFRALAERGLEALETDDPESGRALAEMHAVYAFAEEAFPRLFNRWADALPDELPAESRSR